MKNFRNKNKIYIQDWLEFKPYSKQVPTDSHYLKLANKVKEALLYDLPSELEEFFETYEINMLACFLTSYFEDIISETNIWNTFAKKYKELYHKEIPFYEIDNEYYPGEINYQDVTFLIWYFFNSMQDEKIIHFYNDFIEDMAFEVIEIFEEEFETAPENEHLKFFYQVNTVQDDFYTIRTLINTVLTKTYLFIPDTGLTFRIELEDALEDTKTENEDDYQKALLYLRETELTLITTSHTKLLNFKGNEWLSYFLGENHPLYNDILNMGKRIAGWFFYKGEDECDVFLEYIASGNQFKLTKKSLDDPLPIENSDGLLFVGIQHWKNEWWFSGNIVPISFNADLILDQKNSITARQQVNFIDQAEKKDKLKEIMYEQEQVFLAYNNQSHIAFLSKNEVDKFCENYYDFYNKSLNHTEKEKEDAFKRAREEGFFGTEELDLFKDKPEMQETDATIVFFNPKSGIEIAAGINSAFPTPENKFYLEENNKDNTLGLIVNENSSTELVHYCIANYKQKSAFFNSDMGKLYLKDLDFLLRYYKGNNYQSKPQITLTGKEKIKMF